MIRLPPKYQAPLSSRARHGLTSEMPQGRFAPKITLSTLEMALVTQKSRPWWKEAIIYQVSYKTWWDKVRCSFG